MASFTIAVHVMENADWDKLSFLTTVRFYHSIIKYSRMAVGGLMI